MSENNDLQVATKTDRVKQLATAAGVAATYALVSTANAAPIEVPEMTDIVTMITGMVAVVASVGMAVLSVYATAKVFKWVKTAF